MISLPIVIESPRLLNRGRDWDIDLVASGRDTKSPRSVPQGLICGLWAMLGFFPDELSDFLECLAGVVEFR